MLDNERLAKFSLSEQLRLEKRAVLVRDQNLELFKGTERELERKIENLEVCLLSRVCTHECVQLMQKGLCRIKSRASKLMRRTGLTW